MANGTIIDPHADLKTAVEDSRLEAGDTVWLLDGAPHVLSGNVTPRAGITVRAAPGMKPKVDLNGFNLTDEEGTDPVVIRDLEFYSSELDRTSMGSFDIFNPNSKIINCVLHDFAQVGVWSSSGGFESYGNLFYNMGNKNSTLAHALYIQNIGAIQQQYRNTVILPGYSEFGIHAYGESGDLDNFLFNGIVHIGKLWLVGGVSPFDNITISDSFIHRADLRLGYNLVSQNGSVVLNQNNIAGYVQFLNVGGITMTNNRFRALPPRDDRGVLSINWDGTIVHTENINFNEYDIPAASGTSFSVQGTGRTFQQWQDYISPDFYDAGGTYTYNDIGPDSITYKFNAYSNDEGLIIVRNWSQQPTVTLVMDELPLNDGRKYQIINVQNPTLVAAEFVYNSADPNQIVSMDPLLCPPVETFDGDSLVQQYLPDFACFLVKAARYGL